MTFPDNISASDIICFKPYQLLADNIASHSIDAEKFKNILTNAGLAAKDGQIVTRYYYLDQIMEVNDQGYKRCYTDKVLQRFTQNNVELVTLYRHNFSPMAFPLRKKYHHARQSVVFTKLYNGYKLELEILITDIKKVSERDIQSILDSIDEEDSDIISLSYQLVADKDGRYHDMLDTLRSMN